MVLLLAAVLVQVGYWVVLWRGFGQAIDRDASASSGSTGVRLPVSVVVAVRNEEAVVGRLLSALERQMHDKFEVIVVDDGSSDRTREVAREWTLRLPHFRMLAQEPRGKKAALTAGIRTASHEHLAFTDADCVPGPNWLATLGERHKASPGTVLIGYSPIRQADGLAGRFARYETALTGFFMVATAGVDRPYMAVGRNLSYPRGVFAELGGFEHSMQSLSGDDDLFVQEVARRATAPIRAILDDAAFVPTDAPPTWKAWIQAKRRHTSAGRFYRDSIKAHLIAFHLSNVLVWLSPLVWGWWGAAALGGRLALQYVVLRGPFRVLGEDDLSSDIPLYEALYLLYNIFVAPLGVLRMPRRW